MDTRNRGSVEQAFPFYFIDDVKRSSINVKRKNLRSPLSWSLPRSLHFSLHITLQREPSQYTTFPQRPLLLQRPPFWRTSHILTSPQWFLLFPRWPFCRVSPVFVLFLEWNSLYLYIYLMNSFLDTESVALLKAIIAKNVTGQFSKSAILDPPCQLGIFFLSQEKGKIIKTYQ